LENGLKTKEKSRWALKPRLACQQISNSSQPIRLKWSLIPAGYALGNSCNFVTLDDNLFPVLDHYLYFLLGVLNSSPVNMHFKLFSSNNHISNSEIGLLPIPKVNLEIEKNISRLAKSLTLKYSSKLDQELDSLVHKAFGDH